MRASTSKRSTDEIVTEILEILEAPAVEVFVRKLIDCLHEDCPPFTGNRSDNRRLLRELREQTTNYKKLLENFPEPLRTALFSPETFGPLLAPGVALGAVLEINPETRDYLRRRMPARLTELIGRLDWLYTQCDQINLGMHGLVDYQKQRAAIASRDALEVAASKYPEKRLSFADLDDSDYCLVASLFYEAITGKDNCNLRRQCRNVSPPKYTQTIK
jgi:hypothetical protein